MPGPFGIPGLTTRWPDVNAALAEWKRVIEAAVAWDFGPGLEAEIIDGVTTVRLVLPQLYFDARTTPGGISARSGNTLGQGNVVLQISGTDGVTLIDGPTVRCTSNFTVAIPHPRNLGVMKKGTAYALVGADCPP